MPCIVLLQSDKGQTLPAPRNLSSASHAPRGMSCCLMECWLSSRILPTGCKAFEAACLLDLVLFFSSCSCF